MPKNIERSPRIPTPQPLPSKASVESNKPINQGEYSHHDGEYKGYDKGAVQRICEDQEAEDDAHAAQGVSSFPVRCYFTNALKRVMKPLKNQ